MQPPQRTHPLRRGARAAEVRVRLFLSEVDAHVGRPVRAGDAHALGRLSHDLVRGGFERHAGGAEHPARRLVERSELGIGVAWLVEDVRVDERATADSCSGKDERVPQEGEALDPVTTETRGPEEPADAPARARKVARAEAPPRLEHAHAISLLAEPQGCDAPPEATADHEHVVPE
jgi:hypothetical protein